MTGEEREMIQNIVRAAVIENLQWQATENVMSTHLLAWDQFGHTRADFVEIYGEEWVSKLFDAMEDELYIIGRMIVDQTEEAIGALTSMLANKPEVIEICRLKCPDCGQDLDYEIGDVRPKGDGDCSTCGYSRGE